ncbi:UDP-N-acetylmuramate--L-alanine ligase [bacterium]|nr:MAG: UDP-N-acetylmuramate--L-alanine ligase [bacterium]
MNLLPNSKIYFIGIGGIAMSAAAGIAKQAGFEVTGSDSKALYDPAKSVLDELDIDYFIGYSAEQLKNAQVDVYVASAGEDLSNPEIAYLRDKNIEIYSLSELLHALAEDQLRIVVTGTHGKSTTTAMLGQTLQTIDDSSFMTGAVLAEAKRNFHYGTGHYFVFEGDEYKALYDDPTPKFQQYHPDILLLTNLEFDHPDVFNSIEEIQDEFRELIDKMPDDGIVVYNADSSDLAKVVHTSNLGQVSFALDNSADFTVSNIETLPDKTMFTVNRKDPASAEYSTEQYAINAFGRINVYNALGVISLLRTLGFSHEQVQDGLDRFRGIKRRFEYIGQTNGGTGAKVFDDYAHHPTAVKETLATARLRFPNSKIWAVFEPHTFSRTEAVLADLSKAFESADKVLLAEIYPAREKKTENSITGQQVVEAIAKNHTDVQLVANKNEVIEILQKELSPTDVVIVMAVGSFNTLALDLVK